MSQSTIRALLYSRDDVEVDSFIETAAHKVPLTVIELHGQALEEIYKASLLLVRPDRHVAWRGASVDRAAAAIIDRVRGN